MSFEGSYQFLCENGHDAGADCYSYYDADFDAWKCGVCGAGLGWWNLINVTNGSYCQDYDTGERCSGCEYCDCGRIDGHVELEINKEAVTKTCNLGCAHVVEPVTYKIPIDKGHTYERKGESNEE